MFESIGNHGVLTQDMMLGMVKIMECAMQAGASHARVQLLRQSFNHFCYTARKGSSTMVIHDAQTHTPLVHSKQNVLLSRIALDLVQWLRGQGVQVLCATSAHQPTRLKGEPSLASWLYVVAVFIPLGDDNVDHDDGAAAASGRMRSLWNSVYMPKCLDASALDQWAGRAQRAFAAGATHTALCTLYLEADFVASAASAAEAPLPDYPLLCTDIVRHHLTMQPALSDWVWRLHKRFSILVGWVRQYGYRWTLCHAGDDGAQLPPRWVYFTLLLDPLVAYEIIPQ